MDNTTKIKDQESGKEMQRPQGVWLQECRSKIFVGD